MNNSIDNDDIKFQLIEKVGHITMDRPPHNYTDLKLLKSLADQFESCQSSNVRAILLSSTGKNFCAGADFSKGGVGSDDPQDIGDSDIEPVKKFERDTNAFYYQALRIINCNLPIVCLIQGAAVGAGLGLALAADYRIGTENAKFSAPFVKLGIHPGFGLTYLLPKLIGHANATDMLLTGRRVLAKEGLSMGLLNRIVSQDQLLNTGIEIATQMADNAPLAVAATKKTLNYQTVKKVQKILLHELSQQVELITTKDAAIGIEASLSRTTPKFSGE